LERLGPGEREAIALALSASADVLLTDDKAARRAATQVCNIAVSGTVGVLYEAAADDLIPFSAADFDEAVERLLVTNFRRTPTLLKAIQKLSLNLHERKTGSASP